MAAPKEPREFHIVPDVEKLLDDNLACFSCIEREFNVSIPPKYFNNVRDFYKTFLERKLGKFDDKIQCVPVSYRAVRQFGSTGKLGTTTPWVFSKIKTEYIVFKPDVGSHLKAKVEKLSKTHVGLLVHECFNATIYLPKYPLPETVHIGDVVLIEVVRLLVNKSLLSMDCKLDSIISRKEEDQPEVIEITEDENKEAEIDQTKKKKNSCESDSGIEYGKATPDDLLNEEFSDAEPATKKKKNKKRGHEDDIPNETMESSGQPKKKKKKSKELPEAEMNGGTQVHNEDASSIASPRKSHKKETRLSDDADTSIVSVKTEKWEVDESLASSPSIKKKKRSKDEKEEYESSIGSPRKKHKKKSKDASDDDTSIIAIKTEPGMDILTEDDILDDDHEPKKSKKKKKSKHKDVDYD